jgi:transcriptional regulator with XRE-family HTH domain
MTGTQLRHLRESRGLTREQLAAELGDCTASTLNKWEREINPVPTWVEEKMLRTLKVTLPLEELHWLLDEAITTGQSAETILADALRLWLHNRQKTDSKQNVIEASKDFTKPSQKPLYSGGGAGSHDLSQVAEEHSKYLDQ